MRKTLIIILLLLLVSLSLIDKGNVGNESYSANNMGISFNNKITATNAIVSITNDTVLQSYAISGTGTSGDPYVLGNFVINNCTAYDTGINITNTTKNFILTNVTVSGCFFGINLYEVSFGSIVNSTVSYSASVGISLNKTSYSVVNNVSISNSWSGISLRQSTFNNITNINGTSINRNGFSVSNSSYNIVLNNSISKSTTAIYGIQMRDYSNHNTIENNTLTIPNGPAYSVESSSFNTLINNTGSDSQTACFQTTSSNNNTLTGNTFSNCSIGVGIQSSNHTIIAGNSIFNSKIGIKMISSSENTIAFNAINITYFSLSSTTGIILYQTVKSYISDNILYNNLNGVNLTDSSANNLSNNVAASINGYNFYNYNSNFSYFFKNKVYNPFGTVVAGFYVKSSINVTLLENSVLSFNGPAYYVSSSDYNDIKLNYGNTQGNCFQLENVTFTHLENNTAEYCSVGMYIHNSNNNTFTNNTVTNCITGFQLLTSSSNTLINNYGLNNTAKDYEDLSNLTNTLIDNYFMSNTTNSSLIAPIGSNTGSSVNMFGIPNITLPEITALTLIVLIPFIGLFAYSKLSGKKKGKFSVKDLQTDFSYDKHTPLRLMLLGPIIGVLATIYYSNKHKNLDYFSLKSNELRGNILTILEEQHFIHFNKLREYLNCGVSILKWHIQVLNEFKIVNWSKIGQYKVIYLVEKPPAIKEVNLFYSLSNDNVIQILEEFLKTTIWKVDTLANKSLLRKDSVLHHCKKLADIKILKENKSTHEFMLPPSTKELVRKILFKKVYYNSRSSKRTTF